MDLDIATATATELTQAIRDRQISSRELLDELLIRSERLNQDLNAIVAFDVDRARAEAAAADEATARGDRNGPLHGLPMTVKDVWETKGLVTTSGAPELAHYVPTVDAIGVARLRQAGAIIFGKTNTPMYAGDWQTYNDVYGRSNNPWDVSRTPGGSSGGAAAAVAAGLTPLELGSDIGGSIRLPAHCCGVYGLKPSWGVVPVRGHIPGPPGSLLTVDVGVAGPMARSVADLRAAFDVLAGPLPEDAAGWRLDLDAGRPIGSVSELRVATVFADGTDLVPVAGDVSECLADFAARLSDAGAAVESVRLPVPLADALRTWRDVTMPILAVDLPDEEFANLTALQGAPGDDEVTSIGRAMTSRFRDVMRATQTREVQRAAWAEFFTRYDVVLAPALPTVAITHDTERPPPERTIDIGGSTVPHYLAAAWFCALGAMLMPIVALPIGLSQAGLPVGMQVIGPFLADLRLLRIAELLDTAAGPGFIAPPLR